MALTLPKLDLGKKQLPAIVGGVVVLAAAGWFGWQYFAEEAAPPPVAKRPQPVTAAKPPAKAAAPADSAQARDKLVGEVLAASGLKQELDQLPGRLVAGVRQSGKEQMKAPPALINAIEDVVAEAFTAEGFQSRVSAALKKDFDPKRLQGVLKDFSTPTGKSMVEQERAAQSPDGLAAFARSAAAKNPERAALIKRIDTATRASELAVDVAFASMKALAMGIVGEGKGKTASVDQAIEAQRAESFDKIRNATRLNIAFSFKDASDADLEKYAGIYESENSKWFYGLIHAAIVEEASAASTAAGERISKLDIKPMAVAARHGGPKSGADARSCLGLATNTEIIKCAEEYL